MSLQKLGALLVSSVALGALFAGVAWAQNEGSEAESPEYYPDEELELSDLKTKSLRELSLMRNAIYARAGNEFSTDWIQAYFEAQDWYEGGGLDRAELSEMDRRNIQTILDAEKGLSERALRNRRERAWAEHGGVPADGEWSFPGPFSERKQAIEARLIDKELDELLEETGSYRRPWDPGKNDLDGGGSISTQLGDVALGESLGDLDRAEGFQKLQSVELVEGDMKTLPVAREDGTVEQIVGLSRQTVVPSPGVYPPRVEEGRDHPEKRLTIFTRWATAIVETAGPPSEARSPDYPTLVWKGEEVTLQLDYVRPSELGIPSAIHVRALLQTHAPDRICGPEDGFDEWYAEFRRAMTTGKGTCIARYFDFPFADNAAGLGGWEPDPSREFDTREEFLKREAYGDLTPGDEADPRCTTRRRGYAVSIPNEGALKFERVDGEWKAVRIGQTLHW